MEEPAGTLPRNAVLTNTSSNIHKTEVDLAILTASTPDKRKKSQSPSPKGRRTETFTFAGAVMVPTVVLAAGVLRYTVKAGVASLTTTLVMVDVPALVAVIW